MARIRKLTFPKESGFDLIPTGRYRCTIFDIDEDTSSEGNSMLIFQYKIFEGEYKGRILFENFVLVPQSMWRLQQVLRTFGVDARDILNIDLDALLGAKCEVQVAHEKYEGETRARVKKVRGVEVIKDIVVSKKDVAADIEFTEDKPEMKKTKKLPEW